ncbi:MAG: hypothetical protein JWL76_369 [Thermoleophilia bacterium]|nr:hypothetical protein [Thermoleophilia bacterium]
MNAIRLNTDQWLDIDPEYRAIVDHTPHVFAYDEELAVHVLVPVAITDLRPRQLITTTRPLQLA